jgi:hypothetical protein
LNANISRQLEFLQNAWVANTKFSGVTGESDPLLGNRESPPGGPVTGNFTIPAGRHTAAARVWLATVHDYARRRVFFPTKFKRLTLLRRKQNRIGTGEL